MKLWGIVVGGTAPVTARTNGCCSSMYSRLIDVSTEMPPSSSSRTSSWRFRCRLPAGWS
jgi:hypothetical protein